jgi:hypothetical protein
MRSSDPIPNPRRLDLVLSQTFVVQTHSAPNSYIYLMSLLALQLRWINVVNFIKAYNANCCVQTAQSCKNVLSGVDVSARQPKEEQKSSEKRAPFGTLPVFA